MVPEKLNLETLTSVLSSFFVLLVPTYTYKYIHTHKHTLISTGNIQYLCRLQIYKRKVKKKKDKTKAAKRSEHTQKKRENCIYAKLRHMLYIHTRDIKQHIYKIIQQIVLLYTKPNDIYVYV